jgi:hypothetical protein
MPIGTTATRITKAVCSDVGWCAEGAVLSG